MFKGTLTSAQRKLSLELIMVSILLPIDINSDSTSQNEGFVKKIRFHYAGKLLSPAGISKKHVKNGFK